MELFLGFFLFTYNHLEESFQILNIRQVLLFAKDQYTNEIVKFKPRQFGPIVASSHAKLYFIFILRLILIYKSVGMQLYQPHAWFVRWTLWVVSSQIMFQINNAKIIWTIDNRIITFHSATPPWTARGTMKLWLMFGLAFTRVLHISRVRTINLPI